MNIDMSKIFAELGEDIVAQCGEPAGLDRGQSVRVAQALSRNIGGGKDLAVKATAAETGLTEEVIAAMLGKLTDVAKDKLLNEGPVGDAVENAKAQAMAAIENVGGAATKGMLGKLGGLFGKKAG
jgi:hypothetical protein